MRDVIDMRSDTVTRPTPEMREAMAAAEVGDDVYGEDPTVNRLEAMAAEMLGKEAGLLVPSGSMGNAVSILAHTQRGDQLIAGRNAHIMLNEQGGVAVLAAVMPMMIDEAPDGSLPLDAVRDAIQVDDPHHVRSRLVAIENTHNGRGGQPISVDYTRELAALAQAHGLILHIDGARIFNAAIAQGVTAAALVAPADSAYFCLSKGLSAPVGSVVVGTQAFIAKARRARKLLGGGMRQAGVFAAAGIVALETMVDRLAEDHANAKRLAAGLATIPGLVLNPDNVPTNMVYFDLAPEVPVDAGGLSKLLRERGVLMGPAYTRKIRACTHAWIDAAMVDRAIAVTREVMAGL